MTPDKGQALMLLLRGKGAGPASDDKGRPAEKGGGENYDEDMKAALADLAAALGVTLKDPARAIEAMKTLHDLCDRATGDE